MSRVRGRSGNLPSELTSFVGRRREMTDARRLLTVTRLLTLTGIGGVGKTRLALRIAVDAQRAFDDGVWLVELGELQDETLVTDAVTAALALRDPTTRPALETLLGYFRDRRVLLVLDNCEHLVDAVARMADALLRACPELRILATSREPLGIGGEMVMRVPPLTVPDPDRQPSLQGLPRYEAVTLFTDRAVAAVPEFGLNEGNQGAVAGICQRLDGLPLPIELAAVRLRAMSAEQILQRLTDRYRLLTAGVRGAPSRQQTLRLCIDWSYELCSAQEQELWGRLAVFAGGFELDAAESICAGQLSAEYLLDLVAALVDKSILIREEAGAVVRYRLLETLREYGREKLQETGEYAALRRRHRDWYQQLALRAETEWISSRQQDWIARLEREQPNLREALQFCLTVPGDIAGGTGLQIAGALYPFWLSRGLLSEGRLLLERVLASPSEPPTPERVKCLYAASVLAGVQGDLSAVSALVEEARVLAERIDSAPARAISIHAAGRLAVRSGDLPNAVMYFESVLGEFRAEGDILRQVECLLGLALACGLLGDTARAVACHQEVLAITELHGESVHRAYSLWALGLAMRPSDAGQGTTLLEQSLRLARSVDDPLGSALSVEALAWVAADEHRPKRAAVLMGAAEALRLTVGSSTVIVPNQLAYHEECERLTRRALGEHAFEAEVRHGRAMGSDAAIAYALDEKLEAQASAATVLTRREREVAELVAKGLTNRAIADKLVIAQRTAQGHVEHVLAKLGFTSRTQIAAWIVEQTQDDD
ncbi:LuxR family transcriptional regulator [Rhodococcus sp. SC4]|nr:LuxR family transcriptional regulator [Rhodococcus sp. SC4]